MQQHKHLLTASALMVMMALVSCSDELTEYAPPSSLHPLNLSGQINQNNVTRANDYGFVTGDRMGIYVVDYEDNQPGNLSASNIRAQNVLYTFDGDSYSWSSSTTIYWRDQQTPVSIYGYYPGQNYIANPTAWNFSVQTDQSTPAENGSLSGYEQSDLLWGKEGRVEFTQDQIVIKYHHILAGVRVHLNKGTGISDTEWQKLEKIVLVDHTKTSSTVDLSTGSVVANGEIAPIRMAFSSPTGEGQEGAYRAVVIPQTIAAGKQLLSITLDGQTYSHKLTTDMVYQSGKLHNFTMTVNKSEATGDYEIKVTDDGITPWVNDETSHQFTAMAYVTVHCPQYGTLKQCITNAGYDYKTIQNLKVTGEIDASDNDLLNGEMPELRHLNLKDARVRKNPNDDREYADDYSPGFAYNTTLRSLVLPKTTKVIGSHSFYGNSGLMYSTLEIPEGVTKIEWNAFLFANGSGVELILPTTIDTIEVTAFGDCNYKCELKLTDNIKYIEGGAFSGTPNFYGIFHVPSQLKVLDGTFQGLGSDGSFTGTIEIPQGITHIGAIEYYSGSTFGVSLKNRVDLSIPEGVEYIGFHSFAGLRLSSLRLNTDLNSIYYRAFDCANMPFPITLPNGLKYVGNYAFRGCGIEGELVIPESLVEIGEEAFYGQQLSKITLPSRLQKVERGAFRALGFVKELVIPKYVDEIGEAGFADNPYLQTIICLNPEPPVLGPEAFDGVYWDKVVLQVPEQSVELYRHTEGWDQFQNITAYHELAYNIPSILCLDKGTTREGIVRAEGAWEVIECPDWVTVSPMSGTDEERKFEVDITVKPMASGETERTGRVVFSLKDKGYTTYTDIRQVGGEQREDQTIVLQEASAGAARAIPIFIIGEGYNADDIVSGQYLEDMRQQMENLFSCEPYKTYRNRFTVSTAIACAPEHGISGKLHRFYSDDEVWDYAKAHGVGISDERMQECTILVLRNVDYPDNGTAISDDGRTICYMGKSQDSYPYDQRGYVLHELGGIAFGKLAPEYVHHFTFMKTCPCPGCADWGRYYWGKERGYYDNISASSKMNDAPWAHLIFDSRYAQQVDMWEGGWRHARGMYRSEAQSVMSTFIPYYNTISRQAIVKRILEYSGETFTLDKFFATDKMEIPE